MRFSEHRDSQSPESFRAGVQSKVFPSAPPGAALSRRSRCPQWPHPDGPQGPRSPRVGIAWDPTGKSDWLVKAAYGIFYEALLHQPGRPTAIAHQRAALFADAAGQRASVVRKSLSQSRSFQRAIRRADDHSHAQALKLQPALRAGLEPHRREIFWRGLARRSRIRRHQGNTSPASSGAILPYLFPDSTPSGDPISTENNIVNQRRLYTGCTLAQPNGCVYTSAGLIRKGSLALPITNSKPACASATPVRPVVPYRPLHLLAFHRRCFFLQHYRLGFPTSRWGKRSRAESL